MPAIIIIGCVDLGIGITVRPVLTSDCIAVTTVTSRLEGRIGGMSMTADTVRAGVVRRIVVSRLIKEVDL